MKSNAIIRIALFSIIILILAGILIVAIFTGGFFPSRSTAGGTVESAGSVAASEIRELDIEWVAGSITINTADTDQISFSENTGLADKDKLVWKQSGNKLTIQFCKPKIVFGLNSDFPKDLVITVPNDWNASELNIDSVSANIDIQRLNTGKLDLVNVSGTCTLTDCSASDVDLETVSGQLNYTGSLTSVNLESVSADCFLTLNTGVRDIRMEAVSGDLTLYLPEEQGFTAEIDGISGDITTDFATTSSGGKHTYGDGSCRIDAECVSGNIIIKKAN